MQAYNNNATKCEIEFPVFWSSDATDYNRERYSHLVAFSKGIVCFFSAKTIIRRQLRVSEVNNNAF